MASSQTRACTCKNILASSFVASRHASERRAMVSNHHRRRPHHRLRNRMRSHARTTSHPTRRFGGHHRSAPPSARAGASRARGGCATAPPVLKHAHRNLPPRRRAANVRATGTFGSTCAATRAAAARTAADDAEDGKIISVFAGRARGVRVARLSPRQ